MKSTELRESRKSDGRQKRKKRRVRNVVLAWLLVFVGVAGLLAGGVKLFLNMGYRHLQDNAVFSMPSLPGSFTVDAEEANASADGSFSGNGDVIGTGAVGDPTAAPSDGSLPNEEQLENTPADGNRQDEEQQASDGNKTTDKNTTSNKTSLKAGQVQRGDKVYEYIDGILTFLVLGIDIDGPVSKSKDLVSGGQSDAIFLVVLNPDTKRISLIGVNRDTMVDIVMVGLGANGENLTTRAELAVQHGFGDGLHQSCELTRDAVSKLFYNLPIHGYVSFNMGGMAALNDAVGSVRLTVLEDMTEINPAWYQGAEVTLTGKDAYEYIHYRNVNVFESARNRLARQKQYLSVFAGTALAEIKKDITLPVTLYQAFKPYTVTDLELDEISYLASQVTGYQFDAEAIYTMEGTTVKGKRFEEFYPDQEALQDLILKVFYREVTP